METQAINPIETVYKGYRFRSRLEARWAVFFDAAGIEYQYEPEGFKVCREDECIHYLPDFYLSDLGTYVEIKPNYEKLMEERDKLGRCIDFNGPLAKGLLVLGQIPYYPKDSCLIPAFVQYYWNSGVCARLVSFDIHQNLYYPKPFRWETKYPNLLNVRDLVQCETDTLPKFDKSTFAGFDSYFKAFTDHLYVLDETPVRMLDNHWFILADDEREEIAIHYQECFEKARQARFEHGEKG